MASGVATPSDIVDNRDTNCQFSCSHINPEAIEPTSKNPENCCSPDYSLHIPRWFISAYL